MPYYISKLSSYVRNGSGGGGGNGGCCGDSYCKDSSRFFSSLATKLLEMTTAITKRIDDIKKNCGNSHGAGKGFLLASIDAPQMTLGVKYEYIEYIKRYGPPTDGKFDETKLQLLREELGMVTDPSLSL